MVINSNLTGTGGSPLEKSTGHAGPKTTTPALNPAKISAAPGLKSLASVSAVNGAPGLDNGDVSDFDMQSAKAQIFSQPANALLSQANLSPETVFRLLQD